MIVGFLPNETIGLFNINAVEEDVRLYNFHLTESRILFFNPEKNEFLSNTKFTKNKFTDSLRKIFIHFSTEAEPGNFIQDVDSKNLYSEGIWRILENDDNDFSESLEQNDHLRLGRQIMRVAKIFSEVEPKSNEKQQKSNENEKSLFYTFKNQNTNTSIEKMKQENMGDDIWKESIRNMNTFVCRICLEKETPENEFLPDICQCKNMPVHINCFRNWMSKKTETNNFKNMKYYDLSQLKCDVCNKNIPAIIKIDGKEIFLVNILIENTKNMVILEIFQLGSERLKGILVINFDGAETSEILLGRSSDCDILFKDVSISRNHAKFVWKQGKFYVFNNKSSKFGTVKKVKEKLYFSDCKDQKFVIDKFLFIFHINKKKKLCKCFKKKGRIFHANPLDDDFDLFREDPLNTSPIENKDNINFTKRKAEVQQSSEQIDRKSETDEKNENNNKKENNGKMLNREIQNKNVSTLRTMQSFTNFETTIDQNQMQAFDNLKNDFQLDDMPINSKKELKNENKDNQLSQNEVANGVQQNGLGPNMSRRIIDVLTEQQTKEINPIDEEDHSGDEDLERTSQLLARINDVSKIVKNSKNAALDVIQTESSRTVSDLYSNSFKEYHFN